MLLVSALTPPEIERDAGQRQPGEQNQYKRRFEMCETFHDPPVKRSFAPADPAAAVDRRRSTW